MTNCKWNPQYCPPTTPPTTTPTTVAQTTTTAATTVPATTEPEETTTTVVIDTSAATTVAVVETTGPVTSKPGQDIGTPETPPTFVVETSVAKSPVLPATGTDASVPFVGLGFVLAAVGAIMLAARRNAHN